jgi:hypothetical protein
MYWRTPYIMAELGMSCTQVGALSAVRSVLNLGSCILFFVKDERHIQRRLAA